MISSKWVREREKRTKLKIKHDRERNICGAFECIINIIKNTRNCGLSLCVCVSWRMMTFFHWFVAIYLVLSDVHTFYSLPAIDDNAVSVLSMIFSFRDIPFKLFMCASHSVESHLSFRVEAKLPSEVDWLWKRENLQKMEIKFFWVK